MRINYIMTLQTTAGAVCRASLCGYDYSTGRDAFMDMVKIGRFLAELRKEKSLTQEQLGEKLGITNKTISRWETGAYMPPVEMLQLMSGIYGVSINEILSGERLTEEDYREKAEENIAAAISESAFSLKERIEYYRVKWKKEHTPGTVVGFVLLFAALVAGILLDIIWLTAASLLAAFGWHILRYNQMMAYVENHAFYKTDKLPGE